MQIRLVVHTIVRRGMRLLVLKRREDAEIYGGYWDAPGGLLEVGEDPETGARRELLEEANLTVGRLAPCAVCSTVDEKKDTQFITIFFRASHPSGEVKLAPEEHTEFRWCTVEEALRLRLVSDLRDLLTREGV